MKLSEKILLLRKQQGLSQEDLADKLGVSRQTIYKWESDTATPEIEKIRQLTQLFNVSFDYLMNDDIKEVDTNKNVVTNKTNCRFTYKSKIQMKFLQADIDHGYTHSRKRKLKNSNDIYTKRCEQMKNTLNKIGAGKTIYLQSDMAACFFENSKEMYFGFYYGGNIQFICPFESFVNVQFGDSGQELSYKKKFIPGIGFGHNGIQTIGISSIPIPQLNKATSYFMIISYLNEGGKISEFRFDINCERKYTLYEYNTIEKHEAQTSFQSDFARSKLIEIHSRLNAYLTISSKIKDGELEVKQINSPLIKSIVDEGIKKEIKYERNIENLTIAENKKISRIRFTVIGLFLAIGLLILTINGVSNCVQQANIDKKNKQIASKVEQLIDDIAEVTIEDKLLIEEIESKYNKLTIEQKKFVYNYKTFTKAKFEFEVIYKKHMDEVTKDDPTRNIILADLNGEWESTKYIIYIADFAGGDSIWYRTYNKQTDSSGLGGVASNLPSSVLGKYDSLTQTKSLRLYEWAQGYFSKYHDAKVYINESEKLVLLINNEIFTKI